MLNTRYVPTLATRLPSLFIVAKGAVICWALLALLPTTASAQVSPHFDLTVLTGVPQGELADRIDNVGVGLNLAAGLGVDNTPVTFGADVGFLIYGLERRREPLSLTIPDIEVDVRTTNNILLGHFFVRLQEPRGTFRPYADALVGVKYFVTQTAIEGYGDGEDTGLASNNYEDAAFSYGVGGGFDLQLFNGSFSDETKGEVYLHVGARYLFGQEADYLRKGDIEREGGRVYYDPVRSATDLLLPQLGVKFRF